MDKNNYPRPSLTVDIVVLTGRGPCMKLLTIRRKNDPYKDCLALPGGFVDKNETAHQAALRELKEETNVSVDKLTPIPLTLRSRPDRDPRHWVVSAPFLFYLKEEKECVSGDDAYDVQWRRLNDIDTLAFDHGAILCEALSKFWPIFPSHDPRLTSTEPHGLPFSSILSFEDGCKVLIYSGSFDPWHDGHSFVLQKSSMNNEYDSYLVIPDQNPYKNIKQKCAWELYKNILVKSREAVGGNVAVYPGFIGMEWGNHTSSWYPHVSQKIYCRVDYLMGSDTFLSLTKWPGFSKIVFHTNRFIVSPRNHTVDQISKYADFNNFVWSPLHMDNKNPYANISSTRIRND